MTAFRQLSIDRLADVDGSGADYNTECVDIQGIVSASSQGACLDTDEYKVHCFEFAGWRRVDGPLVTKELTILRPIAPDDDWTSAFPKLSVCRIRVLLSKDETRAVFANVLKMEGKDGELLAIAEKLKTSVVISTSRFGNLKLNRSIGRFEGKVEWNAQSVDISFDTESDRTIEDALKTAESLWNDQLAWKSKVDEFAVKELLPLKNLHWLDDDERPLTPEQFKTRMTLQFISISRDGEFAFWHNDGNLFLGHSIEISGSLRDGLTRADIPG